MPQTKQISKKATVEKERYKVCPSCGNFVGFSDKNTYCILCGEKLIEECSNCREPIIYPVAKFCPACGHRLVKAKASEGSSTQGAKEA